MFLHKWSLESKAMFNFYFKSFLRKYITFGHFIFILSRDYNVYWMNEKLKVPELNITEKLVKTLYIMFNMYINSFKKTVFSSE